MNELLKLRKKAGMTRQELADELGMHKSTIGYWERGTYHPKGDSIFRLCKILNCNIADLEFLRKKTTSIPTATRNEIALQYMGYAKSMISHMWPVIAATHADPEDMFQEVMERIIKAIESYDPTKGASLKTHLYKAARYEIIKEANLESKKGMRNVSDITQVHFYSLESLQEAGVQFVG